MRNKVLLVDDSALVRRQVGGSLVGAGFAVEEAVDGLAALERLSRSPDVALVVCDMNMPRMNGLELLERVRAEPSLAPIPFLMLTTEGQPELIQRARALGAKGWLVKPFKADLLLAAATKLSKAA